MASSKLRQHGITFRPDNPELISFLRQRKVTVEPLPCSFIHEADAYSAAPVDLVNGRDHAPGTDQGDGKGRRWYFISPATCHERTGGGSNGKRQRAVRTEGSCFWRTEARKKEVFDAGGSRVGYMRTLYYGRKKINSSASFKRLGWCMMEFTLEEKDGADELVLCKVYKSPRTDQETSAGEPVEERTFSGDQKMVPVRVGNAVDVDLDAAAPFKDEDARHGRAEAAAETGGVESRLVVAPAPALCDNQLHRRDKDEAVAEESRDRENAVTGLAVAVLMTFDGSSIPSAERMKAVADLVLSFPEKPVVVLSAMGKTTTNIHLAAEKAVNCGTLKVHEIQEFAVIKELHLRTVNELGLDSSIVSGSLDELEQLLCCVAMTKELTSTTRDRLVFLGECMSTRIFSAYVNMQGRRARQYDGFVTTNRNTTSVEATYPAIVKRIMRDWIDDPAMPIIVAGLFQKGWESWTVTDQGDSSSDLTAMATARDLGLQEIQIWKDVDGVLTCDPKVCGNAIPIPYLTFDEAAELAYFDAQILHPQSMQLAREGGIPVIVKNSCRPKAHGTMITKTRDMSKSIVTCIMLKSNITMLDIEVRGRQSDFVAKAFSAFKDLGSSVECFASTEGNISLTLVPPKLMSCELVQMELGNVVEELQKIATVHLLEHTSIITMIGNIQMSSFILEKVFSVLQKIEVNVKMISQRASKVMKVSLVVDDSEAKRSVQALHWAFFESGFSSHVHGAERDPPAASSSGVKRKADDGDPEALPGLRQERMDTDRSALEDIEDTLFSDNDPITAGDENGDGDQAGYFAGTLEEVGDNSNEDGDLAEFFAGLPLNDVDGFIPGEHEVAEYLIPGGVDNGGYPSEFAPGVLEANSYLMHIGVDDGRYMAGLGALQVDDYRMLIGVDDVVDILQAEAKQKGLAEAAEKYIGFRIEEEVTGDIWVFSGGDTGALSPV